METKQTTVQWLLEQYLKKDGLTQSDVKRALEMEKQQKELFTRGLDNAFKHASTTQQKQQNQPKKEKPTKGK